MENELHKKLEKMTVKARPKIFVVVGMAGSGKTTFCQRLYSWVSQKHCKIDKETGLNGSIYSINLDPAVVNTKMPLNLDIRDHIDYYELMKTHALGPNGATNTALNLFMLKLSTLVHPKNAQYIIIDTPGQIESFTWSSPGYVIKDFFKDIGDITMVYLVDSVTSQDPTVFMSNMIYAVSLVCRYDMPVLCTFNKTDVLDSNNIQRWIQDYEGFRADLNDNEYSSSLLGTLALYFEEIYNTLDTVSVSAKTGVGQTSFFDKIEEMSK